MRLLTQQDLHCGAAISLRRTYCSASQKFLFKKNGSWGSGVGHATLDPTGSPLWRCNFSRTCILQRTQRFFRWPRIGFDTVEEKGNSSLKRSPLPSGVSSLTESLPHRVSPYRVPFAHGCPLPDVP